MACARAAPCRSSPEEADVVVVNTCSVTASADQAARQTIRRIARANPDVRVVVTGCYATRQPAEVSALPNVVRVVGNADKDDVVAAMFGDGDGPCGHTLAPGVAGRTALTLRVQTGCDEACSYCIIPRTRGTGTLAAARRLSWPTFTAPLTPATRKSRLPACTSGRTGAISTTARPCSTLVARARRLARRRALSHQLARADGLHARDRRHRRRDPPGWRRISTFRCSTGRDEMLRAMRRPYTSAFYRGLIDRIRTALPHAAIGSDIIVGFPGENDAHFAELRGAARRACR